MSNRTLISRRFVLTLVAIAGSLAAQPAPTAKPTRVLYIGNSYTAVNNLPKLVEAIAESQKDGPKVETEASLRGGMNLKYHWENGQAVEAVRKGGWDFVVLQDHSLLGKNPAAGTVPVVDDPALYLEYARKFAGEIERAGARTLLYATWAREHLPEQQRRLDEAFTRLARETGAGLVPVGLAWTVSRIEMPGVKLHMSDRSHPTAAGSYLAALLFYRAVTGRIPVEPPCVITNTPRNSDRSVTLVNLTPSDAAALQIIAQRVWEQEPLRPGAAK